MESYQGRLIIGDKTMSKLNKGKLIGTCGVDSGQILIIVIPNCLKRDMITWGENHTWERK